MSGLFGPFEVFKERGLEMDVRAADGPRRQSCQTPSRALVELNHCVRGGRLGWFDRQWFNKRRLVNESTRLPARCGPVEMA